MPSAAWTQGEGAGIELPKGECARREEGMKRIVLTLKFYLTACHDQVLYKLGIRRDYHVYFSSISKYRR
jgi:hypothetical protein